jgi:hypothetical protein
MPVTFILTALGTASVYASSGLPVCVRTSLLSFLIYSFVVSSAERKKDQVCSLGQYQRVFERLKSLPSGVEHVIIQIGAVTLFFLFQ